MYDNLNPDKGLSNARQIVGFRDRLIHAYEMIDNTIIWAIIKNHLESLKQEVFGKNSINWLFTIFVDTLNLT